MQSEGEGRGRLRGACLAVVAALAWLAGQATAVGDVSLPPDAGAPPGSSTPVPLQVDDAGGLLGADIVIQYDPSVAQAQGLSLTPLSAGCVLTYNLGPPGSIRVSLYGTLPLVGGGELLTIDFSSVGPLNSETPLQVTTAQVNEEAVPVNSGHYCVQDLVAEVMDVEVTPVGPVASIGWTGDPAAAAYNLYRASQADLGDLESLASGLTSTGASDADSPASLFLYLVTAVNCRGEGTAGEDSNGATRLLPAP